jgi:hypothetical protein
VLVHANAVGAVPCRQCRERRLGEVRVRHNGSLNDQDLEQGKGRLISRNGRTMRRFGALTWAQLSAAASLLA